MAKRLRLREQLRIVRSKLLGRINKTTRKGLEKQEENLSKRILYAGKRAKR